MEAQMGSGGDFWRPTDAQEVRFGAKKEPRDDFGSPKSVYKTPFEPKSGAYGQKGCAK